MDTKSKWEDSFHTHAMPDKIRTLIRNVPLINTPYLKHKHPYRGAIHWATHNDAKKRCQVYTDIIHVAYSYQGEWLYCKVHNIVIRNSPWVYRDIIPANRRNAHLDRESGLKARLWINPSCRWVVWAWSNWQHTWVYGYFPQLDARKKTIKARLGRWKFCIEDVFNLDTNACFHFSWKATKCL